MVTSNRFRPPALLAKMAATVDVVAGGRLVLGLGVGSRPDHPIARREYLAHGLPFIDTQDAIASLDEACTVIRRLWTDPEPFDFHGQHVEVIGAFANPKPVQRTPILIGGRSKRRYGSSLSTPTSGTFQVETFRTASPAARCSTTSAPRSTATPRRSHDRSRYRCHTTGPRRPVARWPMPSPPASVISS